MSDNYEFEESSQQDTDDYSPYVDKTIQWISQ